MCCGRERRKRRRDCRVTAGSVVFPSGAPLPPLPATAPHAACVRVCVPTLRVVAPPCHEGRSPAVAANRHTRRAPDGPPLPRPCVALRCSCWPPRPRPLPKPHPARHLPPRPPPCWPRCRCASSASTSTRASSFRSWSTTRSPWPSAGSPSDDLRREREGHDCALQLCGPASRGAGQGAECAPASAAADDQNARARPRRHRRPTRAACWTGCRSYLLPPRTKRSTAAP